MYENLELHPQIRKLFFRRNGNARALHTVELGLISYEEAALDVRATGLTGKKQIPRKTKAAILAARRERRWAGKYSISDIRDHHAGRRTLFASANPAASCPVVQAQVDLDAAVHTPAQEADAFMAFLRDRLLPGLYWEPSTRGRGRHGLVWILKEGYFVRQVRDAFDHLDAQVKRVFVEWKAAHPDTTLKGVEVKGHPPVEKYLGWQIVDIQLGQLRKVFRPSIDRLDEYMASTALTLSEITALDYQPQAADESVLEDGKTTRETNASTKGHPLPKDLLDALEPLARWLQGLGWENQRAGRFVANLRDAVSYLMVIHWCSGHMNEDGSMPTARIRAIYNAAVEAGDFSRPYNPRRARAIRDWMEAKGLLTMVDRRYWATERDDDGNVVVGGYAARWHLKADVYVEIAELVAGADSTEILPAATTMLRGSATPADGVPPEEGIEAMSISESLKDEQGDRESTFGDTTLNEPLDLDDETLPECPDMLMEMRLAHLVGLIPCPPHQKAGPIAA